MLQPTIEAKTKGCCASYRSQLCEDSLSFNRKSTLNHLCLGEAEEVLPGEKKGVESRSGSRAVNSHGQILLF